MNIHVSYNTFTDFNPVIVQIKFLPGDWQVSVFQYYQTEACVWTAALYNTFMYFSLCKIELDLILNMTYCVVGCTCHRGHWRNECGGAVSATL